ncbi:amidase [Variovorax sp. RTB1]|uniref:amidase n=1 Tax=Variovorax sp. RTB1 TaxID=3048631 RepID=UPI002B2282B1|nr:amidase [Variovorax sp. RTB1]MEB0112487.1 amidase [Variovorax sp. RTB1]
MNDALGAFVAGTDVVVQGATQGPLAGLSFAAKDLFDVQGYVTGCGNPDWLRTHAPARRSAWCVERLLAAGATLVGKTVTDEISLGLLGINRFYGTPVNPRAVDRVAGGSSSGSAAAVAGGLVDVALGTDSGGSVRVPSSYTGVYGLRPTHGAIPVEGMMTQSPTFDTVGFFADDAARLEALGDVLLPASADAAIEELLIATDAFALVDDVVRAALAGAVQRVSGAVPRVSSVAVAPEGLATWCSNQRLLQSFEFGRTFASWVDRVNPTFSFEVGRSLALAARVTEGDLAEPHQLRASARARLDELLGGGRILCLPTTPQLPVRRDATLTEMSSACDRIVELTCIAGLTGLPQVNLPLGRTAEGIPVGLSLIGSRGADRQLLKLAGQLSRIAQPAS